VQRDQQEGGRARQPGLGAERVAGHRVERSEVVEPRRAGADHGVGRLAHRDQAVTRPLRRDAVQVRERGDRVAELVVEGAGADFAAVDVTDRDAGRRGGGRGGEGLEAVAQQDADVGGGVVERSREPGRALRHLLRHRRVAHAGLGQDALGDVPPVGLDPLDGPPVLRGQVRPRRVDHRRAPGQRVQRPQHGDQEPVVGSAGRHDGDGRRSR
jgi:hypothetical protein